MMPVYYMCVSMVINVLLKALMMFRMYSEKVVYKYKSHVSHYTKVWLDFL